MSGTVMSPRRKKRFLKKTADFFYAGEELILAVAYRNVPGAVTAMMRSKPHPNTSLTGTVRRMVEMAGVSGQHPDRSVSEQQELEAIGSTTGETGFPREAGWVAFTRGRVLVFPTTIRLGWPSQLAVAHPVKSIADIETRQLMHGQVNATFRFVDGSSARVTVIQDGDKLAAAFGAAKGEAQ